MRVRMAPSPTGDIHLGSARTTLVNYLLARRSGGTFILRIEDTDAERSDPAKEAGIYAGLRWLGLLWDEGPDVGGPAGPYRQSERFAIHAEAIRALLQRGLAYHDYTSADERAAERELQIARGETPKYSGRGRHLTAGEIAERQAAGVVPAVRFKSEPQPLAWDDLVLERIEVDAAEIEDFVIARGDGSALYNLACVVDDRAMGITHVVRGKDHVSNTFRQLLLYKALGWAPPAFGHLPLVVNLKRQKLSKRDGAQWIGEFRALGFLPEAVVNFIIFLGWAPGDEREIFTLDELVREFSIERVNKSDAVFDQERLNHFNGVWIRRLGIRELAERALPYAEAGGLHVPPDRRAYFETALALEHERLTRLTDVAELMAFFFDEDLNPDVSQMALKTQDVAATAEALAQVSAALVALPEFTTDAIEVRLRALASTLGWSTGDLFMPLRIAVTGRKATPPLFATIAVLGRARCLARLTRAIANLKALTRT